MIKSLKKIIGYYLKKEKNIFFEFTISGFKLKGLKGTNRKIVDQDDAWFFALAKNSTHVFDLGSNIGYMSLLAAIQKSNKKIVLVDPNPEALAKAAQNIIINGFGFKAKFYTAFISDNDNEIVKFYTVGTGEAGSMYASHAETASLVNSFYDVQTIKIDTIVENEGYIPDLIKIDVEGAESIALEGAVNTAKNGITKFIIEMHSFPELSMKENGEKIIKWCKENEYKAYYLKEGLEFNDSDMIATRGKCHLLLIPINDFYPEYLKSVKQKDELPNTLN